MEDEMVVHDRSVLRLFEVRVDLEELSVEFWACRGEVDLRVGFDLSEDSSGDVLEDGFLEDFEEGLGGGDL